MVARETSMASRGSSGLIGFDRSEPMLLPQRASTIHSIQPNGADITLVCTTREGGTFYCKDDKPGRLIRAAEMLYTRLAGHVNLPTPFCSVIELEDGSTLFGSLANESIADEFEVRAFLSKQQVNEIGAPSAWIGQTLARIYAFDLFIGNPDRSLRNFMLERGSRMLAAYDFASAELTALSDQRFSVEHSHTIFVGRFLRNVHGFEIAFAFEMLDRLNAVPVELVRNILGEMPDDWLPADQRGVLCDVWVNQRPTRLAALRAGLKDGSLL